MIELKIWVAFVNSENKKSKDIDYSLIGSAAFAIGGMIEVIKNAEMNSAIWRDESTT